MTFDPELLWTASELKKHDWRPVADHTDFVHWRGAYLEEHPFDSDVSKKFEQHKAMVSKVIPIGDQPDQYVIEIETANTTYVFAVPRPMMAMLFATVVLNDFLKARQGKDRPACEEPVR